MPATKSRAERVAQTAAACEATKQLAAERAIDDPVKLERAARIVRTALARKRLDVTDLTEPDGGNHAA